MTACRGTSLWCLAGVLAAFGTCAAAMDLGPVPGIAEPAAPKPTVSVSANSVRASGTFEVIAHFQLAQGVHLYKGKTAFAWTRLDGADVEEVVFPEAKRVPDPLAAEPGATMEVYEGEVTVRARLRATGETGQPIVVEGRLLHQSCTATQCFPPAEEAFRFELATVRRGLLLGILLALSWGVLAGLSPCVYPMIPVTAAVIGSRRDRGLAAALGASVVYVFGMSLVYAAIGVLAAVVVKEGSRVSGFIYSAYVLVPVAAIFVALAVVMFAGLNLALPTGFAARLQGSLAGRKGLVRTLGLGAVTGLVASPCTTGAVALVLAEAAKSRDVVVGFALLFAFAWGMGVPLIVFGMATGLLPRAGAWMDWGKRLIGFVLLWAAVYFVRPVIGEVAYGLGFALLLVAAAVFLGGLDALTKESKFLDRLKKVLGVIAVMYAAFLFLTAVAPHGAGPMAARFGGTGPVETGENVFKPGTQRDVDEAIAAGKPLVIDFSAGWCKICKLLDREVFTRPEAVEAAKGVAAFKVDFGTEHELAKRYGVLGVPRVVFVGKDGKERKDLSFAGEKTLEDFVKRVRLLAGK